MGRAMTFADAVRSCLSKYATFSGRAQRSEYWYFVLFFFLGSLVCGFVDHLLFGVPVVEMGEEQDSGDGPVELIFGLAMFLPMLAAGWRRMHDTGRSGLLLLYPLIVMVGIVVFAGFVGGFAPLLDGDFAALLAGGTSIVIGISLIVLFLSPLIVIWWLASPSEPGPNDHGPNPREVSP
jgi:uncharacterized membrane protein YhaH (DUF805 family)